MTGDVLQRLAVLEGRVDELERDRDRHTAAADQRAGDPLVLTPRERELVYLVVAEACSVKQVAYRLGIAKKTVENHMTRIRLRLGVQNRMQLFIWANEHREAWDPATPGPESVGDR